MEVVIDGTTGLVSPEPNTPFAAIFEALRRSAASRRRVIVSFTLDGEVISRDREARLAPESSSNYSLLEVRTVDPFQISLETLAGMLSHLRNLEKTHDAAAGLLAEGAYPQALGKFDDCLHGWDILLRAVKDVGGLTGADFRTIAAGKQTVDACLKRLQAALVRFKTAFDMENALQVADVADNELRHLAPEWRSVIEALGQFVAHASGSAR